METWTVAFLLIAATSLVIAMVFPRKNHFNPGGKHCYIGGGSEGLGFSLAQQLVAKGAHVSIVSRSAEKLKLALQEIERFRVSPEQKVLSYACDLTSSADSTKTYALAIAPHGSKAPDYIFTCAGGCVPTMFTDMNVDGHWSCMEWNFKTALCTIHDGIKGIIKDGSLGRGKEKRKIVLTSSILSMMGFAGYSSYSPGKYAIRGLAESLRNELILYDVSVHLFLPATIHSPGFAKEQLLKPELAKKIEGPDEGKSCDDVARELIKGLERNDFYITYEPVGHMLRNSRGITPRNNVVLDTLWGIAGTIALPIWRILAADGEVRKEAKRLAALRK